MTQNYKHRSREDAAKAEIGHTDSTRGINRFLALFFLALLAAVPLLQTLREFANIRAGREQGRSLPQCWDVFTFLFPQRSEVKTFIRAGSPGGMFEAGKAFNNRMLRDIGAYEAGLKDRDALIQWLIPRMQVAITGWLKGGNEDAYCSRDDWLFYRRDIDSLTGPGFLEPRVMKRRAATGNELKAPPQPDPVRAIVDFRDQLAARGIELIVLPAPVKATIHPERFSSRFDGRVDAVQNASFAEFKAKLEKAKIRLFDPATILLREKAAHPNRSLYLKTDTHWTPAAMECVAGELADITRQAVALPPALKRHAATGITVTNLGDVAMMLKLPPEWKIYEPEMAAVRQVSDGANLWRPDPKAEVLFLGDSFANIYSLAPMGWGEAAGFVEHLSLALGLPVDSICRNDAGSYATREMLAKELSRGRDRLAGKKIVIWEFASRELACGDWKLLPLSLGVKKEASYYTPAAGRTLTIRGVVRAASPAPRPGSVPYKDHIIMVHIAEMTSAEDPAADGREAVVFVWSMRDNVQTAAASWRPGDAIALRLRSWAAVAGKYEAINRSELLDENLLLADPAWGE